MPLPQEQRERIEQAFDEAWSDVLSCIDFRYTDTEHRIQLKRQLKDLFFWEITSAVNSYKEGILKKVENMPTFQWIRQEESIDVLIKKDIKTLIETDI